MSIAAVARCRQETSHPEQAEPANHFSLSRLIKVSKTGQVAYKAEKDACRAFPDPCAADLVSGAKRNFQILSPLDFLAEFTQHIPPKGAHLIRYYGWYSNKARGLRKKAVAGRRWPSWNRRSAK